MRAHIKFVHRLRIGLLFLIGLVGGATAHGQSPPKGPKPLVEFPIFSDGDFILLPVEIGGRTYSFVYDTGTANSIFDEALWHWLGMPLEGDYSLNNEVRVNAYRWPKAKLGGTLPIHADSSVVGMDLSAIREISGHNIMGVLGLDWQDSLIVQGDFPNGRLRVYSELPPELGTKIVLDSDFDYGRSMRRKNIRAKLPGVGLTSLLVDTGFSSGIALVNPEYEQLQGQSSFAPKGQRNFGSASITGRTKPGRFGVLSGFEMAGFRHESVWCHGEWREFGLIGLGVLAHYRVTFEFSRPAMYLADPHGLDAKPKWNQTGLSLLRRAGKTFVRNVEPDSPASKAGIAEMDQIVTLNGRSIDQQRFVEIHRVMAEAKNGIDLAVLRGDKPMQFKLQLGEST